MSKTDDAKAVIARATQAARNAVSDAAQVAADEANRAINNAAESAFANIDKAESVAYTEIAALKLDDPGTPPPDPYRPPGITAGKNVVFSAPFNDANSWRFGKTSAYPYSNTSYQSNPGNDKLDILQSDTAGNASRPQFEAGPVGFWRFSATPGANGQWNADLATTENSINGFQAKAGDELSAVVVIPYGVQGGAWPAIWTWKNGDAEVDIFEWHPNKPRLLEFSNHAAGNQGDYYQYVDDLIVPGVAFTIVCKFKAEGVEWWINGKLVAKKTGVPANWSAYLIVNQSVSAGRYHPKPPTGSGELYWDIKDLQVWR